MDSNSNGRVDAGETDITAQVTANFSLAGGFFSVDFDTPRQIAGGGTESYLIVLDFAASGSAAAMWLLLPLFMVLAFFRKLRLTLLAVVASVSMVACSGGGSPGSGNNGGNDNTLQFRATRINATVTSSGDPVLLRPLPIVGPLITVR